MGNWFSAETRGAQQLATSSTDMGIQLEVRLGKGEKKIIDLCDTKEQLNSITVLQLKEKIIKEFGSQRQPSELRLFCRDMELEEPALLSQCGIKHMSTIYAVRRVGLLVAGSLAAETRGAQQLATSSTDMGIWLNVCGIDKEVKIIDLCDTKEQFNSITVLQLKEKIIEEFGYLCQPSEFHLIYAGKQLEDPYLLSQYGIIHMSTVHVVERLLGGGEGGGWGFLPPVRGDGGMGDKDGKNRSMEIVAFF